MAIVCTQQVTGIPQDCRKGNNFVLMKGLFFFTRGYQFADAATAGDDDNWKSGVVSGNIYPIHDIKEVEDLSGEDVRYESPGQDVKELFEGKRRFKAKFDMTLDQHKALRNYSGKNLELAWYDRNNNIYTYSSDGTIIRGMDVDFLDVPKQGLPTADTPMFSEIEVQLSEAAQWDDFGAVVLPTQGTAANKWLPSSIESVSKVIVDQVGTVSGNAAIFDVSLKSLSETDNDGSYITDAAITGLDVTTFTNFTFTDGSAVVVPDTMTEDSSIPGRYTANFTTFTSGTVQIVATTSNLYESDSTTLS
jgi:hypothetical protein